MMMRSSDDLGRPVFTFAVISDTHVTACISGTGLIAFCVRSVSRGAK